MAETFDADFKAYDRRYTEEQAEIKAQEKHEDETKEEFLEKVNGIYEGELIDNLFDQVYEAADLDPIDYIDEALQAVTEKQRQIWQNYLN